MSRFHRVVRTTGPGTALVEDSSGRTHAVSLLALDGPPPEPGEWLVVHSGYAIDRASGDAGAVSMEIDRAAFGEAGS